jgi:hypothetical protein|tara:strand:- start:2029 stop:2733 length:705 start_codon:yes stop_codon:yes gene_type:complete
MVENNILERLRNLFAMAEHETSNEHEAAVALEKAQKLLLEHNLTRASIVTPETTRASGIGKVEVVEANGYPWRKHLLHIIAKNNLCSVIVTDHEKTIHLFGNQDNVRSVLEMYYWIAEQLIRLSVPAYTSYKREGGHEATRTFNTGFYRGATDTLSTRLRKPLEEFTQGAGSALVLINTNALATAVKKIFPRTSTSRGRVRMGDGFFSGRQAGHNVTLGRTRSMSAGRQALTGR